MGGYRDTQPKLCTDQVYTIMLECWSAKAADRPTFAELIAKLEDVESPPMQPTDPDEGASAEYLEPASNTYGDGGTDPAYVDMEVDGGGGARLSVVSSTTTVASASRQA